MIRLSNYPGRSWLLLIFMVINGISATFSEALVLCILLPLLRIGIELGQAVSFLFLNLDPSKTIEIGDDSLNKSWLGSLINMVIGNLKLSISNIHIKYEDLESNTGHPFAAGVTLDKLSAIMVDDNGKETFVTGGALDQIQKVWKVLAL